MTLNHEIKEIKVHVINIPAKAVHSHGSGDVAGQIVDQLMGYPLEKILKKSFFDLPIDSNSA